jgi:hypothetical protein
MGYELAAPMDGGRALPELLNGSHDPVCRGRVEQGGESCQ